MLAQYQVETQSLLQNPGAPTTLYSLTDITRWVNLARGQLAGEAECIRINGTIATVANQRAYNFSDISLGPSALNGARGAIHIRSINVALGDGQFRLNPRPWEWFNFYNMNNVVPELGQPQEWAQFGQGSAGTSTGSNASGSFYLDPPPDQVYDLVCDCVCYPVVLVDDDTIEAIPYLWTDAVPFFAAYYALLSSQTSARQADADRMLQRYQEFMMRARTASNASVLRFQYEQAQDIAQAAKFGIKAGGQQ